MTIRYINFSKVDFILIENEFFNLYHLAFPSNERQSDTEILQRLNEGKYKALFAINDQNKLLGFALLFDLKYENWCFVDYLAISEEYRNQGLGGLLVTEIKQMIEKNNAQLILEAENPNFGIDRITKLKRIDFYMKNGFKVIKNFDYLMPSLDNTLPTQMLLLCYNSSKSAIKMKQVFALIEAIYINIYHRNESYPTFSEMKIQNIAEKYFII